LAIFTLLLHQLDPALFEHWVRETNRDCRRGRDANNPRAEDVVAVNAEPRAVPRVR
jgi:hypothetical protein